MWRRRHRDGDLDEELRYHVERQIEQNVRAGMRPDEARRQALLQFGNMPLVKEDTRAVWTRVGVEQLLQDPPATRTGHAMASAIAFAGLPAAA